MGNKGLLLLRLFLVLICAFHAIVGVGLNISAELPKAMAGYYGAQQVNWTPELIYMLHPLGAFMIVLGLLALVAARDPLKHRAIVYAFSGLFILRGLQRIVFHADTVGLFGISPARNMANMAYFVGMGLVLLWLYHYVARHASSGPTTGSRSDAEVH